MINPEDWRPVGELRLEQNALTAVTMTDRNVVVAAGPGAGKTELLAQRADFLLRTGICPYPRRILAISFKIDAARNLRDRVRVRSGPQFAARFDSFTFHAFAKRLIDNYRPTLTGPDALPPDYRIDPAIRIADEQITFDDLVPLALKILETNQHARGALRQTYSHVFLDEFQDATRNQYGFVCAAFKGTPVILTAVGDVKQRIMAWAGALNGVLKIFAEDFTAEPLPLYQNFRSAPRLRRMQNRMIAVMDPQAVSPDEELVGDEGLITVRHFDSDADEAIGVADLIEKWLQAGVAPAEIAVLVRQQASLVAGPLVEELHNRDIACRNEQERQDLNAEPVAALIFNFIRVVADDRQPQAYTDLMRIAGRAGASEEAALRFDSRLKRLLREVRAEVRRPSFGEDAIDAWAPLIRRLLDCLSRPVLAALSPAYQQGSRLDDIVDEALGAFEKELLVDGSPAGALKRLSELDAVRILTIHKCKGLEFEKVIVLGVEEQLFWGDPSAAISEFFVAISRAKNELVLTHVDYRARPAAPVQRWDAQRTAQRTFLDLADQDRRERTR
ncbi:UvrD-helicase domain-containing protein [Kribbella jiaozuonensis]|uniref:DNA 3'-5' helicase n=1 Tax=Kribbella jiaozuonensis TaxID=2575441 RepID=A0A4V5V049_9ACTN|nr:ATP-dependent helicase [Kribbella jiaozuonensis]TKK82823.1 ATP-dependent helicase [Kribbella jiaozuonensis]